MKKKPESGAYLVKKYKPIAASFLFTSDDQPTNKEGERSQGCRAGQDPEASLSDVSMMTVISMCVNLHLKRHACLIICVQSNVLYDLPTHLQA
jgi:hypothetical protein